MYKKFILEMINHAIEKEFGSVCEFEANTRGEVTILPSLSDEFKILFHFETIFEDVKVHGYLHSSDGSVSWLEGNNYRTMKEYYSNKL